MATYSRVNWQNKVAGGTKLGATLLNAMDAGIFDAQWNAVPQASSSGNVPLTARGTSGQTADLFRVQNSTPTTLLKVQADGSILGVTSQSFNMVTGNNGQISAGSQTLFVDETNGDIIGGRSALYDKAASQQAWMPDFMYSGRALRLYTRSAVFREQGDPVDIQIGRAGPDEYPEPAAGITGRTGINGGVALGTIYGLPWRTNFGGTPDVTAGGSFDGSSGSCGISLLVDEAPLQLASSGFLANNAATGGYLYLSSTPNGANVPVERLRVSSTGAIVLMSGPLSVQIGEPSRATAIPSGSGGTLAANTYFYVIVAVDSAGNLSSPSGYATTTAGRTILPVTTGSTSSIALNWSGVTGASSYRIYRGKIVSNALSWDGYFTSSTASLTDTGSSPTAGSPGSSPSATAAVYAADRITFNDGTGLRAGAWQTYVPTWTGSGSNPVIGNGSIIGRYTQIGRTVHFRIKIIAGSTTTFGSGTYDFGLPTSREAGAGGLPITGGARVIDSGSTGYTGLASGGGGANTCRIIFAAASGGGADIPASATVPIASPGSTDTWEIVGTYETA